MTLTYDDANQTVEYIYDTLGRVSQRKATNGVAYTTAYSYAAGGYGANSTSGLVSRIAKANGANAMNSPAPITVTGTSPARRETA